MAVNADRPALNEGELAVVLAALNRLVPEEINGGEFDFFWRPREDRVVGKGL